MRKLNRYSKTETSEVTLHGFYITPFGKKVSSIKGRGAVQKDEIEIDFDAVVNKVITFFNEAKETIEDTNFNFDLKTASQSVKGKYLEESIIKNIDEADFLVIDWTTLNHNVLFEAGYGKGRAKPSIDLSADNSVPSDRSGVIYVAYEPDKLEDLPGRIITLLHQFTTRIVNTPRVFDYYDFRAATHVQKMIKEAKREICILQTNLETVNANLLKDLTSALKKNVKVRILTLDPQSRYVNERALQLGYENKSIKVYRNGLQNSIDNTTTMLSHLPGFKLRLYNDFPNQLTYQFDDYILASIISRTRRSRTNCCFLLPSSRLPGPKRTFVDHFNELWEKADQEIPTCKNVFTDDIHNQQG